jgi:hypothetical protein
MKSFREYVESLDDETKHAIISDYTYMEETGSIGESAIRTHAVKYKGISKIDANLISVGQYLTMECYRYFYMINYE